MARVAVSVLVSGCYEDCFLCQPAEFTVNTEEYMANLLFWSRPKSMCLVLLDPGLHRDV